MALRARTRTNCNSFFSFTWPGCVNLSVLPGQSKRMKETVCGSHNVVSVAAESRP